MKRGDIKNVLVFTRTKHRANRLAENLARHGVGCERIHGNRSQAQRTEALAGFKDGRYRVLVATDIAARGIDVEALSPRGQLRRAERPGGLHPPRRPHRPRRDDGRRVHVRFARGEARTSRAIERAIGKRLPRMTVPGFDYAKAPAERFEVPIAERIAAIRARKAEERKRAREKAERRVAHEAAQRAREEQKRARPRAPQPHAPRPAHAASQGHPRGGAATPFGRRSR